LPDHKSCKKRLITNAKRRERNRTNKAMMRGTLKEFRTLAANADTATKLAELPALYSLLDVQARKGVIPRKRASRLKSRLAALAAK
jgi:small subunit ribosomal protein S20